jgi:surfeit locus 1 family protein
VTAPAARPRFPWILTVCVGLTLALLLSLGVWQVQRLAWKQDLIARAEAAARSAPAPIQQVMAGPAAEFRQVTLDCPGLATAPYVELQTIQDGQAGVRLISACPVAAAAGSGVAAVYLVDRGFVADVISARPPVSLDNTPTSITAVVRATPAPGPMALPPSQKHFYARDNAAMARALGVTGPVGAETLFAVTSSNPEWAALQPSAPPPIFVNNHLGYAITWFGLAIALVAFYVVILRRRRRS